LAVTLELNANSVLQSRNGGENRRIDGLSGVFLMYPVSLEVKDRLCLVVGGGGVALRKVQGLVEEGARVTIIAPELVTPLAEMAARGEIVHAGRPYQEGDAAGGWALVFAATDHREVNEQVFRDAEQAGVWCNVADDPELCRFHLPARVRRGPLQIAIGSAGEAPFVVRRLRRLLEERFGWEWSEWLSAAARYRRKVRDLGTSRDREETLFDRFFRETVDSEKLTARVPNESEMWALLDAPENLESRGRSLEKRVTQEERAGFVSLVGAGPGCPGLLTVRGRRRLMEADAVVFDRLARAALPTELDFDVELHPVGKAAGSHPVPQEGINDLLVRLARAGKRVVRLKGGDPYVFGRGGEEAEVLAAENIDFEVVPGVTSGVAAMAWAGIPATHRREAVRLTLFTAHEAVTTDGPQVRWDLLAQDRHATLVGYMGVGSLPAVVSLLVEHGMDPETPAAMVEQGTTSSQRRVISTLSQLPGAVEAAGFRPPALFAIGPTIQHAEKLDWVSRLRLAGQRLLVPASRSSFARRLEDAGAEVVTVPTPVTPAARVVMGALPLTGCVVWTAADVECLEEERGGPGWTDSVAAFCVGTQAAERARERGWPTVFQLAEDVDEFDLVNCIAEL
jgi:uroporphyrin-III C-methyltransferase/precorrin-2 dehydrogenase/sirohydrochlorin ferrochelatase